jgi:CBS domain-containing protein
MNIRQFCTGGFVSALESASVEEIAHLMRDRHVGAVVILGSAAENPAVVGIVTDRDIMRAQLERTMTLAGMPALSIMTGDPLVLREDIAFNDALDQMALRGVRRAPVVDAYGALVGLISIESLIAQVARELGSLASVLTRQPTTGSLSTAQA